MKKIIAAVLRAPHMPLELWDFTEPPIEPNAGLLDVELSEVCGTDVHLREGRLPSVPYPIIPGHVAVGTLRAIRGVITDADGRNLKEGDVVTFLDVHSTCNMCWYCSVAKVTTRCPHRRVYGVTYGVADGVSGAWAESVYLKPGTRCVRLERVDPERFMAGGCSLPTALHAVELGHVTFGDTVLVLGSGPVGLSTIICSGLRGAQQVLCVGAPEPRLRIAARVGARATLEFTRFTRAERLEWVLEQTQGRGADVTIEATGSSEAVVDAFKFTRDAGRVVIVGQYANSGEVLFNPHLDLNKKHLEVKGCWGYDFSHLYRSVQLMSNPARSICWSEIPLYRYGLSGVNEALDVVAKGAACKVLIEPSLSSA